MIKFKELLEKSGAGDWGTDEATKTLKKGTPGQDITDIGVKNKERLEEARLIQVLEILYDYTDQFSKGSLDRAESRDMLDDWKVTRDSVKKIARQLGGVIEDVVNPPTKAARKRVGIIMVSTRKDPSKFDAKKFKDAVAKDGIEVAGMTVNQLDDPANEEVISEGAVSVSTVEKEIRKNGGSKIRKSDKSMEFMYRGAAHTVPLDRGFVRDTDYMKLQKYFGEEVNLDEGRLDKSSPIYKEYEALKKKPVSDLRNIVGRSHRTADLKGYDKAGAIRQILDDKFGEKKVDAFFGFSEEVKLDEEKVIKIVADTNTRKYKEGQVIKTFPETKAGLTRAMVFQKTVKDRDGAETTMVRESVELDEDTTMQIIRRLVLAPKMKKMVRFYLDWRRKNPGKGNMGVQKVIQMMGLSPRDGNQLIDTLNDLIKKGELPKHLALNPGGLKEEQFGVDNPYKKYKNDPDRLRRILKKHQDAEGNMRNRIRKFMGSAPSGLKDELKDIEKRIKQIKDVMKESV